MNKEKENKLAGISARITQVIAFLGETPNSFATKLGYPRAQTIYDIQKMKSAPSYDFFQRFSNTGFSAIVNLDWLLTGEGVMLRDRQTFEESKQSSMPITPAEESIIYKMYEKKDAEVGALKEEIGALKAKLSQYESKSEACKEHPKGLGDAKNASTKKSSSQDADNVTSATAP